MLPHTPATLATRPDASDGPRRVRDTSGGNQATGIASDQLHDAHEMRGSEDAPSSLWDGRRDSGSKNTVIVLQEPHLRRIDDNGDPLGPGEVETRDEIAPKLRYMQNSCKLHCPRSLPLYDWLKLRSPHPNCIDDAVVR